MLVSLRSWSCAACHLQLFILQLTEAVPSLLQSEYNYSLTYFKLICCHQMMIVVLFCTSIFDE